MKVLTLVLASLLTVPLALSAQSSGPTSKGNALVGGTASFSRTTQDVGDDDDDESATSVQFSPDILYFVAPRFAIGGVLAWGRTSGGGSSSSSTTLGPEVRVFFADPASRTQPYLGATVARVWSRYDTPFGEGSPNATSVGATAGVIWMVSRQVGISSEAFYLRTSQDNIPANAPDISVSGFGLRFGFAAFLMR
jgi:hypothetical protein